MKFLLSLTIALTATARLTAAPVFGPLTARPAARAGVRNVEELKRIPFTSKPILITGTSGSSTTATTATTTSNTQTNQPVTYEAYKSGSGVVLGPGQWSLSPIATAHVYHASIGFDEVSSVNAPNGHVHIDPGEEAPNQKTLIATGDFSVDKALHTYVLEVCLDANAQVHLPDYIADKLDIVVGSQTYSGRQQMTVYSIAGVVGATGGGRFLVRFQCAPVDSRLIAHVYYKNGPNAIVSGDWVTFYYMQLAQVD